MMLKRWLSNIFRKKATSIEVPLTELKVSASASDLSADEAPPPEQPSLVSDYQRRAVEEAERFTKELNVNALPEIFHYWSNAYVRPRLESFGYSHPEDFFAKAIAETARSREHAIRVISLGSGNCDAEVRVAQALIAMDVRNFMIECLDLTPAMLARGEELAARQGVSAYVAFTQGDFNTWRPKHAYDVVVANQSLHHVTELEHLFDAISEAIGTDGRFVTSDAIGRNGHRRWPEALEITQEFWRELPMAKRYNLQLRTLDEEYLDWDCSTEGFEGIRAQDILPLMIERFGFEFFFGTTNVLLPFVDRSYGHHFDPNDASDRAFIDRVQARDDEEILAGRIKPTLMMAILRNDRSFQPRVWKHLTPAFCVRYPD